MARTLYVILAALIATSTTKGQYEAVDAPRRSSTILDEYRQLTGEYEAAKADVLAKYRKAIGEDKAGLYKTLMNLSQKYAARFLKMANSDPKNPDAYNPLLWLAVQVKEGEALDAAVLMLKKHFADRQDLWIILAEFIESRSDEIDDFLNFLVEKSSREQTRAVACFTLGVRVKHQAERTGSEEIARKAEQLFQRVSREFAHLRGRPGNLGEAAKRELDELSGPFGIGKTAPNMIGEDFDGGKFELNDYRGKVVVLSFSGYWCGPCRAMYPYERTLVTRLAGRPFAFVEINSDKDKRLLKEAMARDNLTWRHVWDGGGPDGPLAIAWQIRAWPTFFVLDAKGVIRHKSIGEPGGALIEWAETLVENSP